MQTLLSELLLYVLVHLTCNTHFLHMEVILVAATFRKRQKMVNAARQTICEKSLLHFYAVQEIEICPEKNAD